MRVDDVWTALGAAIPEILLLVDVDGTILFMNRPSGRMSPDEAVGSSAFDYVPAASHSSIWMALQDVFKRSEMRTMELAITLPTGRVRWVQVSAGPYRDANGVLAATVLARDITSVKSTEFALQQLERQLQQLQKLDLLGQVAGGIAHDFANLLMVVRASIEVLLATLPAEGSEREAALSIWVSTERGIELTRQILSFVRTGEPTRETVDLNVVVEAVLGMLSRLIGADIRLQKRLHPGPVPVLVERGQMDQILSNLVLNARDAMPSGGTLTVTTRVDAGREEVVLSVIDTGSGMDDATQRRIFEPFFTTKPPGRGTGLGLSTVAIIVELLGGRIAVKSKVGVGTTIDVVLSQTDTRRWEM